MGGNMDFVSSNRYSYDNFWVLLGGLCINNYFCIFFLLKFDVGMFFELVVDCMCNL